MSGGFTGKYAVVDLTTGSSEVFEPGEDFYKKYLSGYGLGAAIITTHPGGGPSQAKMKELGIASLFNYR
jgi:aldehyde:ferredoxin oxidoreductase